MAMQTESKSERVVKSLRSSLLIDELDAHIVTAQHFARVTQEELEQLDLKATDPKQKLLISPFGSIRWSRHLMALLYARQQAMLFMMDACARQLGEDSPFKDAPLFIELAGTSNYEHYERALMFALGARPTTSGSRSAGVPPAPGVRVSRTPTGGASRPPAAAGTATSLEGANGRPSAGSNAGACGTHAPGADETSALRDDDEGNFPKALLLRIAEWMEATDEWMKGPRDTAAPLYPAEAYTFLREMAPTQQWAREELESVEKYLRAHVFSKEHQGPGGGLVTPGS